MGVWESESVCGFVYGVAEMGRNIVDGIQSEGCVCVDVDVSSIFLSTAAAPWNARIVFNVVVVC